MHIISEVLDYNYIYMKYNATKIHAIINLYIKKLK